MLRSRRDIACVLVNPLQALHPNASAPVRFNPGGQRKPEHQLRPRCLLRVAEAAAPGLFRAAGSC